MKHKFLLLALLICKLAVAQDNLFEKNISFENQVLTLVNTERANQNLAPLRLSTQLTTAARSHSFAMAKDNFFSHCNPDTKKQHAYRIFKTGYPQSATGENIAIGQVTPASVMNSWMNSSGHRANILSSSFTEIGIGYIYDVHDTANINKVSSCERQSATMPYAYRHYWTQTFGSANTEGADNFIDSFE